MLRWTTHWTLVKKVNLKWNKCWLDSWQSEWWVGWAVAGVNFPLGSLHTQTRTVKQNCTVAVYFVRCSASEKHRILYSFRCFWKWIWCPIDKLLEDRNLSLFFSSLGLDCAHLCVCVVLISFYITCRSFQKRTVSHCCLPWISSSSVPSRDSG